MHRRRGKVAAGMWAARMAIGTVLLALAAPATAAEARVFAGSATDPAGDQAAPARDITAISVRYDESAGTVEVGVRLAAPADAGSDAFLAAVLGRGCGGSTRAVLADRLVSNPDNPGSWATNRYPEATTQGFERSGSGSDVGMKAVEATRLAFEGYDCLVVSTTSGSGATPYDEAQVALAEAAPPAPPPEPPAPPPPAEPAPLGPAPLTRGERLQAALAGCVARPANRRRACARGARQRLGPTRAERLRTALDRCGRRARSRRAACQRAARARFPGVRPLPRGTGFERRLYAHAGTDILGRCGGICWEALAFVDRRYVHVGLPEGAGIPNCTRVTYDARKKEGCATYSVGANRRTVTVAGRTYALTAGGRALRRPPEAGSKDPTVLERQIFPVAGARWNVPVIEAIAVNGSPLVGAQIITRTYLTLSRDGQFSKASVFFGTTAPGSAPTTTIAGAPPDRRGRYEVLPAGTIRLTYADGRVELGSAFYWDAAKGRDPNRAGLHVGDDTFFGPPDD